MKLLLAVLSFVLPTLAQASAMEDCVFTGQVEKIDETAITVKLNLERGTCSNLNGQSVALYFEEKLVENCKETVTSYVGTQFQKQDKLKIRYSGYQGMGPNGLVCMKKWNIVEK